MTTYEIPERNFGWLKEKVEKLNKKAEKLGVTPISITVVGETIKQTLDTRVRDAVDASNVAIDGWNGEFLMLKFLTIEVVGEAPVLAGWKFIGTIQHVRDGAERVTILRAVPGLKIPDEYRDADPEWCDQCKTSRMRNDTFVVESVETSEHKRIGRQCLRDFLGHAKPEMYADWAESLGLLHDLMMAASHEQAAGPIYDRYFPTDMFTAVVVETIARFGWTSGKMAREASERGEYRVRTRDIATRWFTSETMANEKRVDEDFKVSQASVDRAKAALAWARDENGLLRMVREQRDNDYLYNLSQVARLDALNYRMLGLAASLVPAYEREMAKNVQSQPTGTSTHFGQVGVRLSTILTVTESRSIMTKMGEPLTLLKFVTPEGDVAAWFTNGDHGMKLGKTYRVKATVKRHDEYKGLKQTILGRINVGEEVQ